MALALVLPVLLAVIRLLPATTAMSWFAHPWLAVLTYVPISVAGMLIPRISVAEKLMASGSIDASGNMKRFDWGSRWGAVAMYSFGAAVGTHLIPGNGFFSFIWACFLLAANSLLKTIQAKFRRNFSLYALSLAVPILISLYVGVMLWQTLQEKMGMAGSIPHPFGFFVADIIMAATSGYVVILALSPLIPVAGIWLASSRIVLFLVSLSILGASVSPQFFPYNTYAPKRILLQRTFSTQGQRILGADYDLAVFDANSLPFVFKNVEAVPKFLGLEPGFSWKTVSKSPSGTWMAIYPISRLFVESYRFSAGNKVVLKDDQRLPHIILQNVKEDILNPDRKRIYVEIDMGSLHEVWASVLNITGPLTSWSFSDERLPVPEVVNGGPPSYICRLSGKDTSENWKFWLEANTSKPLQVDLAVLDHELDDDTRTLLHLFPSWAATIAGSTYLSSYLI
ncbi:hypothetical protein KP509_04G099400 [Ceratopteris richardii]|uniref:Endoplasmic reticulum metallopeptidase 1-like C-terminal domain-containing protein n=1 Tax=Ceratopteris richardii TaxID=49495 RepID=A0A8T2UZX6_CERRI|nr:hypothetical protein KP509_04G099400 [Ceratopteris richardii]